MAAVSWLLIPLIAALSASLWASWASRRKATHHGSDVSGVAGYERFRQAMERPRSSTSVNGSDDRDEAPAQPLAAQGSVSSGGAQQGD
ncbi:hypothetical protein [Streptomyces sp. NPDC005438]|uniref:hypothetical protein n=1 Tax=Streptomyces sp. NPDC005438 TaxID=3156880 RepID=UPI0033B21E4F